MLDIVQTEFPIHAPAETPFEARLRMDGFHAAKFGHPRAEGVHPLWHAGYDLFVAFHGAAQDGEAH